MTNAAPNAEPTPTSGPEPACREGAWHPRRSLAVFGAVVLISLGAAWVWRNDEARTSTVLPAAPVLVTTAPAFEQDVPVFRVGVGTVTARQSVTVKVRVDGQLDRVNFVEGQDVKTGQLLAELDPRPIRAQLEQAQAQRAHDLAQLVNARADLVRYTNLLAQDASTRQQVDTQKALVAQLEAQVQLDEAQIHYQQVQLAYTRIVAPIAGRTGVRLVDAGNIVHATDTTGLVVINQVDPITVLFTLPEEAFRAVSAAQRISRPPQVLAYPREGDRPLATGRLLLVNNQIDTTTGTVQLKAQFPNPAHALWPGQYVNVRLVLDHEPHALTVPAAAIQRSQDGTFVWRVDADGKAGMQPVDVASIQDGLAVIRKGLQRDERVVVAGQYKLRDGTLVAESRPAARGAAGTAVAENDPASGASATLR